SVAFSRDGRLLASGSRDRTVRVWDLATGASIACLTGHDNTVTSLAFDRDGRRVASASWSKTVRVWDIASGQCLETGQDVQDLAAFLGADTQPAARRQAQTSAGETVVWSASGRAPIAWFPADLNWLAADPSGRVWAGAVDRHLHVIRLEGRQD